MKRSEILWLAFEKFAIFFSFIVTFSLVMILLLVAFGGWQNRSAVSAIQSGIACETITGLNSLVADFEDAVITQTIYISESIPVQFDLPLDKNLDVRLNQDVQLNRPTSFVLPAGGGQINGIVYLVLPQGQILPVHMSTSVEVSQSLPVQMVVPVAIPLKETELGNVIVQLKELLEPLRLEELETALGCQPP
jgi:hypothetical protein